MISVEKQSSEQDFMCDSLLGVGEFWIVDMHAK